MLPEAHGLLGELHAYDLDWGQAEASYRRAINLDPNLSQTRSGFAVSVLLPLGKTDEALGQARKAQELDPLSKEASETLLLVLYAAGRFDETLRACERILASNPDDAYVHNIYGQALTQNGQLAEAIAYFQKMPDAGGTRRYLGHAYAKIGRRADAERLAAQADAVQFRQQALVYSGLGDADRTMDALSKMADEKDPAANLYSVLPELYFLRNHPRYKEFAADKTSPNSHEPALCMLDSHARLLKTAQAARSVDLGHAL